MVAKRPRQDEKTRLPSIDPAIELRFTDSAWQQERRAFPSEVEILMEPYREVKRQVKKKGNTATVFCRPPGVHKHTLAAIMIPIVNKHYGKCSVMIMNQLKL